MRDASRFRKSFIFGAKPWAMPGAAMACAIPGAMLWTMPWAMAGSVLGTGCRRPGGAKTCMRKGDIIEGASDMMWDNVGGLASRCICALRRGCICGLISGGGGGDVDNGELPAEDEVGSEEVLPLARSKRLQATLCVLLPTQGSLTNIPCGIAACWGGRCDSAKNSCIFVGMPIGFLVTMVDMSAS